MPRNLEPAEIITSLSQLRSALTSAAPSARARNSSNFRPRGPSGRGGSREQRFIRPPRRGANLTPSVESKQQRFSFTSREGNFLGEAPHAKTKNHIMCSHTISIPSSNYFASSCCKFEMCSPLGGPNRPNQRASKMDSLKFCEPHCNLMIPAGYVKPSSALSWPARDMCADIRMPFFDPTTQTRNRRGHSFVSLFAGGTGSLSPCTYQFKLLSNSIQEKI